MSFAPLPGKMQGVDSTIKIGLDSSDVDALIEKLERATELASGLADLWPYLRPRVQARDYAAEPITHAERESDRKFFADAAAPKGAVNINVPPMDAAAIAREFAARPPDATEDGLTDAERVISEHLVEAVKAFGKLDRQHPSELREFVDGIHACQNQLAWRIVQRHYPKAWPIKPVE